MCDLPEAYILVRPQARKEHTCYECRGVINPGEVYYKHSGIWDGRPDTIKVCEQCEELRIELDKDQRADEKTAFGNLYETVFESRELKFISRYIENRRRRNKAAVPPWMLEVERELNEANSVHSKS